MPDAALTCPKADFCSRRSRSTHEAVPSTCFLLDLIDMLAAYRQYSHLVLAHALRIPAAVGGRKVVMNGNVQVAVILLVRLVCHDAGDLLAFLDGQGLAQVENCLLPVRVLSVRTGREADRLVASAELDIEPCNQGVDEVVPSYGQLPLLCECKVLLGDGVQVEGDHRCRICDDSLHLDGVDKRLGQGGGFQRRVVEAIDVVPDCGGSAKP